MFTHESHSLVVIEAAFLIYQASYHFYYFSTYCHRSKESGLAIKQLGKKWAHD
jgi:hypothetical protein